MSATSTQVAHSTITQSPAAITPSAIASAITPAALGVGSSSPVGAPDQASPPHATETLREARARYFRDNGFGEDGGYGDAWVDFKLGPIPMPFPNTPGRVRAVRYHDLHHVLTGYATDTRGELEISAWEVGAGCGRFVTAWAINLSGMAAGLVSAPRRSFRAFVRGRHSRSLYAEPFEPLLDERVDDARARVATAPRARASDVAAFALANVVGVAVGLAFTALVLPLVPIGVLAGRRRATEA